MDQKTKITLEACRINAGKTQAEWADIIGVSPGTVSNWESGKSEPTLTQLRRISQHSGISMDNIFLSID
jgi:DNA-binding XRE family transcriptional regulator